MAWLERILKTWIRGRTGWSLSACLLGQVICVLFFLIQTSAFVEWQICNYNHSLAHLCLKDFRFCLGSLCVIAITKQCLKKHKSKCIICFPIKINFLFSIKTFRGPKAKSSTGAWMEKRSWNIALVMWVWKWPEEIPPWEYPIPVLPVFLPGSGQEAQDAEVGMSTGAVLHFWVPRAASPLWLQPARCITCFLLVSRWEVQMFPQVWACDGSVLVWRGNANIAARNEGSQQNRIFWVILCWTDLLFIVWFSLLCLSFSKMHSFHSSKTFPSSQWEDSSGETAGEVPTVDNRCNFLCAF